MKVSYENGSISSDDLLKHLCFTGRALEVAREVLSHREALQGAGERGISVSDEEVQSFADAFRKQHGLHSAEETHEFLQYFGVTVEDFSDYCEASVLMNELREDVADEESVQEFFVNNRSQFDRARLYHLVVDKEPLANEIQMQLTEEGVDFHTLARRYSIDESTKYAGGYLGEHSRGDLSEGLRAKVFNAEEGEILGPVENDGVFQLYRVDEVVKAELDEDVEERIRDILFERWIDERIGEGFEFEQD